MRRRRVLVLATCELALRAEAAPPAEGPERRHGDAGAAKAAAGPIVRAPARAAGAPARGAPLALAVLLALRRRRRTRRTRAA